MNCPICRKGPMMDEGTRDVEGHALRMYVCLSGACERTVSYVRLRTGPEAGQVGAAAALTPVIPGGDITMSRYSDVATSLYHLR